MTQSETPVSIALKNVYGGMGSVASSNGDRGHGLDFEDDDEDENLSWRTLKETPGHVENRTGNYVRSTPENRAPGLREHISQMQDSHFDDDGTDRGLTSRLESQMPLTLRGAS